MRYGDDVEQKIENLSEDELRGVMDRIMRASADRSYFGDDRALNEIDEIIRNPRSEGRTSRLFPKEINKEGKRMRRVGAYTKSTRVSDMAPEDQESVRYRVRKSLYDEHGFSKSDSWYAERTQEAMDSRIGDLEGTIDINRYVSD